MAFFVSISFVTMTSMSTESLVCNVALVAISSNSIFQECKNYYC